MTVTLAPRRVFARFRPRRYAPLRRIPFPALSLAVCLLFTAVGIAALDDYGVSWDGPAQRRIAEQNAAYIMGDRDALKRDPDGLPRYHDRFYGIAFELPLLLVERVLGLDDSRDIYLTRHLLTHLLFIIGGFCCGLLVWRMFNNRWVALLAMLLFLLHPRLYAHSYFNSKDIPFTVMFLIALYLTHRAFRRDTAGAFVLLGVVVGLAVNVRPFALLLLPAVLAMRGLDWRFVGDGAQRRRILVAGGVFAASALAAIYVSQPYYWGNPLRFFDSFGELSQHPTLVDNLFRGQIVRSDAVPADYIPVWFGISTPAAMLLLGIVGVAAILWRGWRTPGRVLRHGELRFLFLVLACFAPPIVVAIILQSHIYNGWRQMYFLWGPFCLLAAAGMHCLSRPGRGLKLMRRMALYGLVAAGLGSALYAIVSLHPHQQIYFSWLADRALPGELGQQYQMPYWLGHYQQGLEYLLEQYPEGALNVIDWPRPRRKEVQNHLTLPAAERERFAMVDDLWAADFQIGMEKHTRGREMAADPAVYQRRAYGGVYLTVVAPRLVWGAGLRPGEDIYRAAYRRVTTADGPAVRADFDVYIYDGALYYVRENCRPEDAAPRFFLHLLPASDADLPSYRREYGFDDRSFNFAWRGGFFDGKCITQEPLPDYPIARISTGQIADGETLWQADFPAGR